MTDELLFLQMKSFSLMLLLMKHIIEVLSVRFKRPGGSLATSSNQSEAPLHTLPHHNKKPPKSWHKD